MTLASQIHEFRLTSDTTQRSAQGANREEDTRTWGAEETAESSSGFLRMASVSVGKCGVSVTVCFALRSPPTVHPAPSTVLRHSHCHLPGSTRKMSSHTAAASMRLDLCASVRMNSHTGPASRSRDHLVTRYSTGHAATCLRRAFRPSTIPCSTGRTLHVVPTLHQARRHTHGAAFVDDSLGRIHIRPLLPP